MAIAYTAHAGSVRRPGRSIAVLHADAQVPAGATAGPALRGCARRLLREDVQRGAAAVPRPGHPPPRGAQLLQAAEGEQSQVQLWGPEGQDQSGQQRGAAERTRAPAAAAAARHKHVHRGLRAHATAPQSRRKHGQPGAQPCALHVRPSHTEPVPRHDAHAPCPQRQHAHQFPRLNGKSFSLVFLYVLIGD